MTDDGNWFDGPLLAAWLEKWVNYTDLHPNQKRRVREWRNGGAASVFTLDAILVERTEVSIWDVPDELRCEAPMRGAPIPEAQRREVARRRAKGETHRAIGRSLGIDHKTVRNWAARQGV